MEQLRKYIVCAGSYLEAVTWCRHNGIPPSRIIYAVERSLTGVNLDNIEDVVTLAGFYGRSDREVINHDLRVIAIKHGDIDEWRRSRGH